MISGGAKKMCSRRARGVSPRRGTSGPPPGSPLLFAPPTALVPPPPPPPPPATAAPGNDLVGEEEQLVLVAHLAHEGEVVVGGVEHAAPAVDRLGDEGGHRVRTLAHDGLFQEARGGLPRGLTRLGALLTVRITGW